VKKSAAAQLLLDFTPPASPRWVHQEALDFAREWVAAALSAGRRKSLRERGEEAFAQREAWRRELTAEHGDALAAATTREEIEHLERAHGDALPLEKAVLLGELCRRRAAELGLCWRCGKDASGQAPNFLGELFCLACSATERGGPR
jgi:hypothetical protein